MSDLCDYEACHAVLKLSKINEIIINGTKSVNDNLLIWLEKTSYEEFVKAHKEGFELNVILPVENGNPIPIGFGHLMDRNQYEKLQETIRSGKIISISRKQTEQIISRNTPSNVYDNWLKCMEDMIQACKTKPPEFGLQIKLNYNLSETLATVHYRPINSEDKWPVVTEDPYVPEIVEWKSNHLKKGDHLDKETTLLFKRVKKGQGTVIIQTNKGAIEIPIYPSITSKGIEIAKDEIEELITRAFVKEGGVLELSNRQGVRRILVKELDINETMVKLHMEFVTHMHWTAG
ncbi:hypothetical protein ABWK34_18730, partial [Bacillus safensis]|uniref:hypothetical protein n=1 Tax=Bacillus safensis TaxID=561879 RepID=UPI003392FF01